MLCNRRLARHVSGVGMSELRRHIEYTSEWAGTRVHRGDRWYPSSKTCSGVCRGDNQAAPVRTDIPLR
jgi:putative transposase